MKRFLTFLPLGLVVLVTPVAQAAYAVNDGDQTSSNSLSSILQSFLPIAFFLLVLFFFLRYQLKSPAARLQRQYLQRQMEHSQRVEELLERIATALEKDRQGDS